MAENEYVFDDSEVAMHPSRMKVTKLSGDGGRWHFAIDPLNHPEDSMHVAALTISAEDAAELMRNLAAFVPEVEPVAWLDGEGNVWSPGKDGRLATRYAFAVYGTVKHLVEEFGRLTPLYAHPPVTAKPAAAPSVCGATVGPVPKLDGERFVCVLASGHTGDHEAIDGTWFVDSVARHPAPSVTDASVDNATVSAASAGLASAIVAMADDLETHDGALPSMTLANVAFDLRHLVAMHGTPGDAGAPEWWTDTESGKKTLHFEGVEWVEASEPLAKWEKEILRDAEIQDLRAEVERYKAALEAAEALIVAQKEFTRASTESRLAGERSAAAWDRRNAAGRAYDAARAAVEAETSEEGDRG